MVIRLYANVSEPAVVDKVIVEAAVFEGYLREESDVSAPVITIEAESIGSLVNYAYIPEFNRYYYINEITSVRTNLWRLSLTCDVLKSFAQGIRNSQAIIEETATINAGGNRYLSNDAFVSQVKRKTDIISFPDGFGDSPYYILLTAGGVAL